MQSSLTVITEALSHDLTTLDRAKRELGIDRSDKSRDTDIREDITMASRMCAEFCRRPFGKERVLETIDVNGDGFLVSTGRLIVLARKPIVEVHTLTEVETDLVLDTDYYIYAEDGMISRGTRALPGRWLRGQLTVEYTAGYELLDGVPWSYERACLIMLRSLWFSRGRDPALRAVDIPDVGSRTYASGTSDSSGLGIPLEAQQLLQPHRRMF